MRAMKATTILPLCAAIAGAGLAASAAEPTTTADGATNACTAHSAAIPERDPETAIVSPPEPSSTTEENAGPAAPARTAAAAASSDARRMGSRSLTRNPR